MPSATTKPRQALKARFLQGMFPAHVGFSELIDAHLNQADDGVIKPPDESLLVVRQNPSQPVLRFFEDPAASEATWQIRLAAEAKPGFALATTDDQGLLFIDQATGHVGVNTPSPAARLTVRGDHGLANTKDPQSSLLHGGTVAIKGSFPQLDFIDTDGEIDWSIHVNSGHLYFIRSPWEISDFHLDGNSGHVGIGTDQPTQTLHVNGAAVIKTLIVDDLWVAGKQLSTIGVLGGEVTELANGNIGFGEKQPAARLVISSQLELTQTPKDPMSKLSYGGQLAIKSPAPQIDFVVTNSGKSENNWSMHVAMGKVFFTRPPWAQKDLCIDCKYGMGVGTSEPTSRLHVVGKGWFDYLIIDDKWKLGSGFQNDEWLRLLDARRDKYTGSNDDYFGGFAARDLWTDDYYVLGSDLRLKVESSIRAMAEGLSRVLALRPIEFRYKSNPDRKHPLLGFLAQDMEAVCPEAVVNGPGDMKGIEEGAVAALLVQSVKEQQARIESLRARIAAKP